MQYSETMIGATGRMIRTPIRHITTTGNVIDAGLSSLIIMGESHIVQDAILITILCWLD